MGLQSGGLVSNSASAVIDADNVGVFIYGTGTVSNAGLIEQTSGRYGFGIYLAGGGTVTNLAGGTISGYYAVALVGGTVINAGLLESTNPGGVAVNFTPSYLGSTLVVEPGSSIIGMIDGVTVGTTLEIAGKDITSETFANGTLTLFSGKTLEDTLHLGGLDSDTSADFTLTHEGAAGTIVQLLCYLRGTRLLTPTGQVKVEDLGIGDWLVTRHAGLRPIKWIGRQSYAARFVRDNRDRIPVRIRADALGPSLPSRDLYVSPGHSMLLGETLVLAKCLVNGVTITQDDLPDEIHYYLIEFESHDCVFAEGCWSESFADCVGLRDQFHNAAEFHALFPDYQAPDELALCRPRPQSGPDLAAALHPVLARAAAGLALGKLRGWIDNIAGRTIRGWAQDILHPELPVLLEVRLGEVVIGTVLACDQRDDLRDAGIAQGRCSFSFTSPCDIRPGVGQISIRRAGDGAELPMTAETDWARNDNQKSPGPAPSQQSANAVA